MEAQERIGTWCAWGVILLSWIGFFLVVALMFRATGCNRSSEAGTRSVDIVAESIGFEALAETRQRAFEIHIERGGIHGCDLDDYLQAERELQEKYNKSSRE